MGCPWPPIRPSPTVISAIETTGLTSAVGFTNVLNTTKERGMT